MTEFKHVVVYGDSLSWGIIPLTRRRLDFASRWPQVMAQDLNDTAEAAGRDYRVHVTEECLNGRRTAFEDPYKPGRSGLIGIQQVIEAQSPLDVVIIMLGTNDFQSIHRHTPWHSAMGIAAIIDSDDHAGAGDSGTENPGGGAAGVGSPAGPDRAEIYRGRYRIGRVGGCAAADHGGVWVRVFRRELGDHKQHGRRGAFRQRAAPCAG